MYNDVPVKDIDLAQLQSTMKETAHNWGFQNVETDANVHFRTTGEGNPLVVFDLLHINCSDCKMDVCLNIIIEYADCKDYAEIKVFKVK